jgi:DNA-binding Lrp family transcriptional regulator
MAAEPKRGRGQPPYEPTPQNRQLVQVLRANGIPFRAIARELKISLPTLRKNFREELANGTEVVVAALGAVVVRAALGGDWRAAKEWLSRFGGPAWKNVEVRQHEYVGDSSIRDASDEEIDQRLADLEEKRARMEGRAVAPPVPEGPPGVLH